MAQLHVVGVVQYGKHAEVLFNDDGYILPVQVGQRIGKAVSYTHLDVYKRQAVTLVEHNIHVLAFPQYKYV